MNFIQKYGALLTGPFLFLLFLVLPLNLESKQQHFLAIFITVVFYWLFTKIPLYITGFLGVSLTIIFNLDSPTVIFANFGHPIIFLFLAGFLLAQAFHKVKLDQRIALFLLTRSFIKGSLTRLLITLMTLTASFTMWISNTATTAMMLPLVLGVLKSLKIKDKKTISVILICIAYASSIGGIATPIGSPPNIVALGLLEETVQLKVSFLEWMLYALPISLLFLIILLILTRFQIKQNIICIDNKFLSDEYKKLPPISKEEIYTLIVFLATVFCWMLPSFLKLLNIDFALNLNAGAIGVLFASLLYLVPLSNKKKILISQDIKNIDWSSLMLFGSGLAFGKLLFSLGLAQMTSEFITSLITGLPLILLFILVFAFVIFSTELTSNTATANIIIPIMISLAISLNINPFFFSLGIALSCSLAFMLPVATPPNAIVYGSEKVYKKDMIRLGLGLNLIFSLLLGLIIYGYQIVF